MPRTAIRKEPFPAGKTGAPTFNTAPCSVKGPPKQLGSLFNIRQDVTSRAAYKYYIDSMVSLYVSTSGLVPVVVVLVVVVVVEFGPWLRFIWGCCHKPGATLTTSFGIRVIAASVLAFLVASNCQHKCGA